MGKASTIVTALALTAGFSAPVEAQAAAATAAPATQAPDTLNDPVRIIVRRLDLEKYKATIKGLTEFGDRRQGTARNRAATDWIEAQLKSYGCTNTERLKYEYVTPPRRTPTTRPAPIPYKGVRGRTGVNTNPELQPDTALRRINAEPATDGPREEVYCTKIGTTRPDEMYIIGAHMDGHGFGAAANDDGSGTALVMELARILNSPDVVTERSIRFALWNNEETGLNGARAYVEQRKDLQGKEFPVGSGKYPEPKWLGMIQHDMMMWDHGAPGPDGKVSSEQRREADVNIEYSDTAKFAPEAAKLAWFFRRANDRYATDYPANVGDRMSNTDSGPFMHHVAAISLRENERLRDTGNGWNPTWHQPIDVYSTFSDKDFRLGLNAAQTTLAAISLLTGAKLKP